MLIAAFVDGELGRSDADGVQEHLAQCDACRSDFDAIGSLPDFDPPTFDPATEEELWNHLDQRIA
jgi:predicted anti-sigma-YlaC factor YlaD